MARADAGTLLLDEVVAALLVPHRRQPSDALAATAAVFADSRWRSYRAGRARVATQAAVYLTWLAPPSDYRLADVAPLDSGRRSFVWKAPRARSGFADLLCPAGAEEATAAHARALAVGSGGPVCFAQVRLLSVSAPTHSMLASADRTLVRLCDSALWFGERP